MSRLTCYNDDNGHDRSGDSGDRANDGILAQQILSLFGDSQIDDFASKLNLDQATASAGLAGVLPDLIDSSSEGGSLLVAAGGVAASRIDAPRNA